MSYLIKDKAVLQTLQHLAGIRKKPVIDIIREAVSHEAEREASKATTRELLQPVLEKARAMGRRQPIDWEAEKRASDELWGE